MNAALETIDFKEGDIIFTSIPNFVYRSIEKATKSPTSHVGIVLKQDGQWMVAESKIPFSQFTPLVDFIARSKDGWFCIKRLKQPLTAQQIDLLKDECQRQLGQRYTTDFNYHGKPTYCSKFVFNAFKNAIGLQVGQLTTFHQLLLSNPNAKTGFWRLWFLGFIPWRNTTITPHSQYIDAGLDTIIETSIEL